jgi:hypothetical protein
MKKIFYGLLSGFLLASLLLPQVILAVHEASVIHVSAEAGVDIWLNNKLVGKTTKKENGLVIKDLAPGEYNLRAAKEGHDPAETQLTVKDDQTIEWRINFAKPVMKIEDAVERIDTDMMESEPVGTIILKSVPLNAEVFLDGKSIGRADKKITYAPAADHSVKFVFQKRELSEKFSLESGGTVLLTADFVNEKIVRESGGTDINFGPAVIKLQTARKKKPAIFPHRFHQEMWGCEVCHHGRDAEGKQTPYIEGMPIQHCVTCHNTTNMKNKELNNFMRAAHARCKGCHKKLVAEGEVAGPIGKCSGCHKVSAQE